jgi:hypothetical protein
MNEVECHYLLLYCFSEVGLKGSRVVWGRGLGTLVLVKHAHIHTKCVGWRNLWNGSLRFAVRELTHPVSPVTRVVTVCFRLKVLHYRSSMECGFFELFGARRIGSNDGRGLTTRLLCINDGFALLYAWTYEMLERGCERKRTIIRIVPREP